MSDFYIGDLTPGTFVVNVSKEKEWGIGQVQSCCLLYTSDAADDC